MSLTCSSFPSAAHVTDFFGFPDLLSPDGPAVADVEAADVPGGVGVDVDGPALVLDDEPNDFKISSNGLNDDGCATPGSLSFFTDAVAAAAAGGIFLKLGISFFVGFGFEKKDESDLASFTTGFVSFLTGTALGVVALALGTAAFLTGGAPLAVTPSALRFLPFASVILFVLSSIAEGVSHRLT